MVWCGVAWYVFVCFTVVWCGVVWHGVVCYGWCAMVGVLWLVCCGWCGLIGVV